MEVKRKERAECEGIVKEGSENEGMERNEISKKKGRIDVAENEVY